MPYKVKASFSDGGQIYEAGQVYEQLNSANADLMEETKEEVTAETIPTIIEASNSKQASKKEVMQTKDIKQK